MLINIPHLVLGCFLFSPFCPLLYVSLALYNKPLTLSPGCAQIRRVACNTKGHLDCALRPFFLSFLFFWSGETPSLTNGNFCPEDILGYIWLGNHTTSTHPVVCCLLRKDDPIVRNGIQILSFGTNQTSAPFSSGFGLLGREMNAQSESLGIAYPNRSSSATTNKPRVKPNRLTKEPRVTQTGAQDQGEMWTSPQSGSQGN